MASPCTYLRRAEIDILKWDACIQRSGNGLVYACSRFLDRMAADWHALVFGDYEALFPLPVRKKFGIRYYFKPAFVQQLGLIGEDQPVQTITRSVEAHARYGTVLLNFSNRQLAAEWELGPLKNRIIDLFGSYDVIASGYDPGVRYSLRKAAAHGIYQKHPDSDRLIDDYHDLYGSRIGSITNTDVMHFRQLCREFGRSDQLIARQVATPQGETLASSLFLTDRKRLYHLVNTVSPGGRQTEANYLLLDGVIREFAGTGLLLDLEGSDLPGVDAFYAKFGGIDQPYFYHHHNQLPFPVNLLKR